TNLYGMNDNFHPNNSHVIPALMRRFHEAKELGLNEVVVWGTGTPKREFLYVDDMAAASVYVMELDDEIYKKNTQPMLSHINVGTGVDCSIREMAETMALVVGYDGKIVFDITKPDGSPRKLMDVTRLENLGWKYRYNLKQGLELTYKWFINNLDSFRS
ncbi:TPA: NAD-dependent epimerase/dehydratase family protein, partial [Escherichia coli]